MTGGHGVAAPGASEAEPAMSAGCRFVWTIGVRRQSLCHALAVSRLPKRTGSTRRRRRRTSRLGCSRGSRATKRAHVQRLNIVI